MIINNQDYFYMNQLGYQYELHFLLKFQLKLNMIDAIFQRFQNHILELMLLMIQDLYLLKNILNYKKIITKEFCFFIFTIF